MGIAVPPSSSITPQPEEEEKQDNKSCGTESCHSGSRKIDYLLTISLLIIVPFYFAELFFGDSLADFSYSGHFALSVFELLNKMWWGLALGILFVGLLANVPREFVISILGKGGSFTGILRATLAGTLLDLCSHGILLVAMKLYERGASLGQVMAFLIASPWNSFSLTLILWALIGLKWTLIFIVLSMIIAVISGVIFEKLVERKKLPANPNKTDLPEDFVFMEQAKAGIAATNFDGHFFAGVISAGLKDSRMILRWILFGVVLASLVRTFVSADQFGEFFGPTISGLMMTIVVATILEVCSEGSTPIAADIMTRASAPGNSLAFLMTGVSTDYTEIMGLKETTKSWKIALFLPLVTLPQVILIGWILNQISI